MLRTILALALFSCCTLLAQAQSNNDNSLLASKDHRFLPAATQPRSPIFSAMDLLQNQQIPTLRPHATLALCPNPTSDFVFLQFNENLNQNADVYLINADGETLFCDKISTQPLVSITRISHYPQGNYQLKVQLENGEFFTLPFRKAF